MPPNCSRCGTKLPARCGCPVPKDLQCGRAVILQINCGHTTPEEAQKCTVEYAKEVNTGNIPDGLGPGDVSAQAHKLLQFCDAQGWKPMESLTYLTTALGAELGRFVQDPQGIGEMADKLSKLIRLEAESYFQNNRIPKRRF